MYLYPKKMKIHIYQAGEGKYSEAKVNELVGGS